MKIAHLIIFLVATGASLTAKERDWKQGEVVEVKHTSSTETYTGDDPILNDKAKKKAKPRKTKHLHFTIYTIVGGGATFEARQDGKHTHDTGPIQYDVDQEHLYLREPDGRVHKLDLVESR